MAQNLQFNLTMNPLQSMNQSQADSIHTLSLLMQLYAFNNDSTQERQRKRQKTSRRRSVSFNDDRTDLIVIDRVENKADVWYTHEDYRSIQRDIMRAFNQRLNGTYQESENCTFCGLEKHLRKELQRKIAKAQKELEQKQLQKQQQEQQQQQLNFALLQQPNGINYDTNYLR